MPIIIETPPEAIRRQRIRHVLYVVFLIVGAASAFLASSPWLSLAVVAASGLAAYVLQHFDSWEPWWPPTRWRAALRGHQR